MSWRRVRGILLQNWYVMQRSPIRFMELLYWPVLELVLWGFITRYLAARDANLPGGVSVLLGAVLLWDVMFRSHQELAMTHLIDMWDKNIVNLYASPLRQSEYYLGSLLFSIGRLAVGTTVLILVARFAFGFDLLRAGATLAPSLAILVVMGWALGIVIRAAIVRFGSNAEVLAWSLALLLQPVSAVFYPVAILPVWLQKIAFLVPASHVFESLRAFLAGQEVLARRLVFAAGLDIVYMFGAAAISAHAYRRVRELGLLSRPGY